MRLGVWFISTCIEFEPALAKLVMVHKQKLEFGQRTLNLLFVVEIQRDKLSVRR